jgi:O-antigen/teichoic acid export membrane protein
MSLKRILKLLAAFLAGQGVSLINQLLVPPMFLHSYARGVEQYGEWLGLTASIAYLSTLNYGIQNYANNQMTIHYNRGELERAKIVQASALRLVLCVIAFFALLAFAVFLLPLKSMLGLRHVTDQEATWTLFLMLMQLAAYFLFGFFAESNMVVGEAHRGQMWQATRSLTTALALAFFVWRQSPFPVLAASQLCVTLICLVLCVIDLRMRAPILLPSLRYGTRKEMMAQIKPSAYFMLLAIGSFFIWQAPLLVIEKVIGPATVAIFALTRTIFSMSRQVLQVATLSIRQEITHLVGKRDWIALRRLYDLSEKVILLLDPVSTMGTLLISPLLFTVWLHKRALYDPWMCLLMATISAVIGIKEHKFQFQWSSNRHERLARFNVLAYLAMLVVSVGLMKLLGVNGFLVSWLTTEFIVALYIVRQNLQLFPKGMIISTRPFFKFFLFMAIVLPLSAWPVWHAAHWSLVQIASVAVLGMMTIGVAAYYFFDLSDVRAVLTRRLRRRTCPAAA